jgi:hypothetical protein
MTGGLFANPSCDGTLSCPLFLLSPIHGHMAGNF